MTHTALALFSGGLDSILSCSLVSKQGIKVVAIKFVSPFFDYHLLGSYYCLETKKKYNIDVELHDISDEYMSLLRNPAHGYGKHFNPCLDCKIFMMTKARQMMKDYNASFLISGEVVGQRPMSQRRDAMRVVERDSGCDGILLRPLCAQRLDPTIPEKEGIVDRDLLANISGRSREGQIAMAKSFGFTDYPTPAGGCILTDPIVGERIKEFYHGHKTVTISDMRLITVGRQFMLPGGAWLVMGRKEDENQKVADLKMPDDLLLKLSDRPGPTAVLRFLDNEEDLSLAASLVVRYGKKDEDGNPYPGKVMVLRNEIEEIIDAEPSPHIS